MFSLAALAPLLHCDRFFLVSEKVLFGVRPTELNNVCLKYLHLWQLGSNAARQSAPSWRQIFSGSRFDQISKPTSFARFVCVFGNISVEKLAKLGLYSFVARLLESFGHETQIPEQKSAANVARYQLYR